MEPIDWRLPEDPGALVQREPTGQPA